MPKIAYVPRRFSEASLAMIVRANRTIGEYEAQGLTLTLRQSTTSTTSSCPKT
jgi:hypothetical protein